MKADDLAYAGAVEQARLIRDRQVSARDVVEATLGRIDALNPSLNAFRVVFAERAIAEADALDARIDRRADGVLAGVPVAVKDDADVAGEVTAWGTDAYGPAKAHDSAKIAHGKSAAKSGAK